MDETVSLGPQLRSVRPRRRRLRGLAIDWGPVAISAVALAFLWEYFGRTSGNIVFPPISQILSALWQFLVDGTFSASLTVSLITLVVGMLLSILVGIGVGALMGRFRTAEYALDVYINAMMAAPMVAFVPVFILLFGIGYPTRVITVILFAIFPIIVNTFTGIKGVDPSLVEMGRSFGANERQLFWRVRVPAAAPLLLAGIRLGTARGVKGLINGEVLVAVVGLGALVSQYGTAFSMDRLYAVIFFIVALALIAVKVVESISRRIVRG